MNPSPPLSNPGRGWRARRDALAAAVLRLAVRVVPGERQREFGLTLVLGALCGLAAVAFHLALRGAEHGLIDRALDAPGRSWIFWTIATPVLGGLAAGVLLSRLFPDARGSGIPQVKAAYAIRGGRIPLRVAVGKFLTSVVQIGSGASLGREGPTVQICAGLSSTLGRALALSRRSLTRLVPVGASSGWRFPPPGRGLPPGVWSRGSWP